MANFRVVKKTRYEKSETSIAEVTWVRYYSFERTRVRNPSSARAPTNSPDHVGLCLPGGYRYRGAVGQLGHWSYDCWVQLGP